jgi:pimeloyl-ACP methyl ester carboxylesterase
MKILLVEGDTKIATVVKRGLDAEGFTVDVAFDGVDGLWLATEGSYDLSSTDDPPEEDRRMNTSAKSGMLHTAGACVHYEIRGDGPPLVLIGCPMDATAFAPLAEVLADLVQLLQHLDVGPAALFGSSGGAVTALALAQSRPEMVHTVVAHEPPLNELLNDRAQRHASTDAIIALYLAGDRFGAWAKFFADANIILPDGAPSPMSHGEPDTQADAVERFFFAHTLRPTTNWQCSP